MKYLKILGIFIFPVALLLFWWNKSIVISNFNISEAAVPNEFIGFRILQVSDLHNEEFGTDNKKLIYKIKNNNPDIIVITGDTVDSRRTDFDISLDFIKQVIQIAPTYYVIGNHETRVYDEYLVFEKKMIDLGVHVLRNQSELITKNNQSLQIIGMDDPDIYNSTIDTNDYMYEILNQLNDPEKYTILLSHRPELFDLYSDANIDLVFSGHVHGGQVQIPFVGGLVGPHQGLLPKYDAGLYTDENTNMILSRGLGNSLFPFRINNRPEITVTTLGE